MFQPNSRRFIFLDGEFFTCLRHGKQNGVVAMHGYMGSSQASRWRSVE